MNDHPMGRPAKPMEIANIALFLSSDMSSFVNGETITVDGGQTRTQPDLKSTLKKVLEAIRSGSVRTSVD